MVMIVKPEPQRGPVTGKVYADGTQVAVNQPRRRMPNIKEGAPYIMLDMIVAVRAPMLLTRTEQVILNVMLGEYRLGEPYCRLNQAQIADRAQIKRPNISAALKRLVEDEWVFKISSTCWYVNPHYGYRGSRADWHELRRQTNPPKTNDPQGDAWLAEIAQIEYDIETGEVQ